MNSAFIVSGGDTVLVAAFQVDSPNSYQRQSEPAQDCFALIQSPKNITLDSLKARRCAAAGFLVAHGTNIVIQNSVDDHSRADAYHVAYGSQNVTVQNNLADGPGDDMFASIGYATPNRNIKFYNNVGRNSYWGGCVHFDATDGGEAIGNRCTEIGVSCFAVSADPNWGDNLPSNNIVFKNNYGQKCVNRTVTGHGAVMLYGANLGPNIVFENTVIDAPHTGLAVKVQGTVEATVNNSTVTNANKCFNINSYSIIHRAGNTLNGQACN
jgi:hypothetical protein